MLDVRLAVPAVLSEAAALSSPLWVSHADGTLAIYLLLHALACILMALFLLPLLRGEQARPRGAVLALLAGFSYAVPVAGFLCAILGTVLLNRYRSPKPKVAFESLQLPEFDVHERMGGPVWHTGMSAFLGNRAVPKPSRIRAMVSLQHVPGRVASPLLRDVLQDPSEDLRLLAYGMLDTLEQRISAGIDQEREALAAAQAKEGDTPGPLTFKALQNLSDLYWEFLYENLVQGDLHDYAAQESLRYCEQALAIQPDNGPLMVRRGRLLHEQGRLDEAEQAYARAHELGLPDSRVVPYQAEVAFERRDFARTRALMQQLDAQQALPRLRPIIAYWSGQ
ncbi:MAG TPA: tetratricopeptide repeat protein [Aquabacterium sp.]|nr:tetratricopeptide repeat protein [Aquabacterium sp.]